MTWSIRIGELVPAAQSLGSFVAWYHTLAGQSAVGDVDLLTVADVGCGHLSRFDVEIVCRPDVPPQFRGTGAILGEGMIAIAHEVIELVRTLLGALEQNGCAMCPHDRRHPGRRATQTIDDLIASAIHTRGQHLLAALTPLLADHRRLLLFVGGAPYALAAIWMASRRTLCGGIAPDHAD